MIEFRRGVVRRVGIKNQPARGAAIIGNLGVFNAGLILSMGYNRFPGNPEA
ncbi:MAG: hypothetical protein ACM3SW_10595 [Actinomycetota bacterium]